ncbi:MAG: hypothetical protein GW941_01195 [Candidatus Pacebacteria bacterium]|nr:hypothetical protein [Candidatus Paceibacterota bacterium]
MEKHSIQSIQKMMPKVYFDDSENNKELLKLIDQVTIIGLKSGSLTAEEQGVIDQCALMLIQKIN